jgi:hypothetical protein
LTFVDTHANPDIECDKLAPDISVFRNDDQPQGDAKTDFSKMDFFVEFKIADTSDPFHDPEDPLRPKEDDFRFENDSDDGRLIRGQLASYAAAHAESTRGSFVVIVMARLLPGTSTILKSPTFSLASFGVGNISIVASRVTAPSHT